MACIFNLFYKTNKICPINCESCKTEYGTDECQICLDLLNGHALTMPCGHVYHMNCVLDWFNNSMTCPCCRQKFKWQNNNIVME